jgi:hypothetical protein
MWLWRFSASSSSEHHQRTHFSVHPKEGESFANFQTSMPPSQFAGTIPIWLSKSGCAGEPDGSECFDPTSNPARCITCLPLNPATKFVSVSVTSEPFVTYYIEFYSDNECTDLVETTAPAGGNNCYSPNHVASMYSLMSRGAYIPTLPYSLVTIESECSGRGPVDCAFLPTT